MASNTSHTGWKAGKETAGKVSGVKNKKQCKYTKTEYLIIYRT